MKRKRRHALVDGPSSGLGDEEIRPDRPCNRETSKDEADVASQIRLVGVDATSSGPAGRGSVGSRQMHGYGQGCKRPADRG